LIWAIIIFGLLILVHEAGHFAAARWAGITVLEFSIGMGPALWSTERGGTRYSLRLLPIGGYVKMDGEDPDQETPPDLPPRGTRRFNEVSLGRRAVVLSAGALMNLFCALLVMLALTAGSEFLVSTQVAELRAGNVSGQAGLAPGDRILRVDGRRIHIADDIVYAILGAGEAPVTMLVERAGQRVQLEGVEFPVQNGRFQPDFACYRLQKTLPRVLHEGLFRCVGLVREIYLSLFGMLTGQYGLEDLSGPVGATQAISEASKDGFGTLVSFAVFISINLGIFNLLPFPALDGGRLLFLLIEKLRGRALKPEVEGLFNLVGFALLMLLVAAVTFRDVANLFRGAA